MIGIGVIGYGYWGPEPGPQLRRVPAAPRCAWCATSVPERLEQVARRYPGVKVTIDALRVCATLGRRRRHRHAGGPALRPGAEALRAGKHVLVEKPMAASSDQAARLIDEAAARRLVLMVDHTFVYTGAVRKMRELTQAGELGDDLLLRFGADQPGPVPARRERAVGPGGSRSGDHGLRADRASRRRVGDGAGARARAGRPTSPTCRCSSTATSSPTCTRTGCRP